ncbi:hypothetical protein LCGC14_1284220 [marine sediment metagenome]|uniref:Helix-turn-helix domain-containing protein n=1 Tax=marine sediment metagenome TaxID=412755 RepID=A0A0F9KW05_9ZZZZ
MTCKWLTVTQMAGYLQVTPRTVYRWCKAGKLTSLKIGRVTRVCAKVPQSTLNIVDKDYQPESKY